MFSDCFVLLFMLSIVFFFKQKTAYELRISDWSSDVCSSDLSFWLRSTEAPPPPRSPERTAWVTDDTPRFIVCWRFMDCAQAGGALAAAPVGAVAAAVGNRKSVVKGKRVSVRGDRGGSRISQNKKKIKEQ